MADTIAIHHINVTKNQYQVCKNAYRENNNRKSMIPLMGSEVTYKQVINFYCSRITVFLVTFLTLPQNQWFYARWKRFLLFWWNNTGRSRWLWKIMCNRKCLCWTPRNKSFTSWKAPSKLLIILTISILTWRLEWLASYCRGIRNWKNTWDERLPPYNQVTPAKKKR
jgi:hypothetical protein